MAPRSRPAHPFAHLTRQQIVARQQALRPQIREAKQRGDHEQAMDLLHELRGLRVQLRRMRHEEQVEQPTLPP